MSGSSPGADEDLFGIELGVARHPDVPAVVDDLGTTWSYAELDDLVNRLISGLAAHGVGPEDCVSVLSRNRAEVLLLHQAVFRGGLLLSPLNYRLTQEEIAYIVGDSDSRVLFVEAEFVDTARAALAGSTVRIVVIDGDGPDSLGSLLEADNSPHPYRYGWMLPYTSGTTGRPKGVIRDPAMTPDRFRRILHFPHAVNYRPVGNRHLLAAPLYHSAPWLSTLHTINVAGTVFLRQRFDAERFLADAADLRITSTYLVPTMFHRLLRLPEAVRAAADLSALGSISHTGSNCPPALKHQMIDWVGPVLYEIYAATEASGYYSICDSAQWLRRPGTVGRPAPGVITIRDEQGHPAPAGVVGRVFASTLPGNNPFYYKGDPDKTAAAYYQGDGQYTVGDVGYLDDEGWLFLTGRSSELIISGGVNIYPAEAESVLIEHPAVLDVAVVGVPDEEWGERAVAVVHPAGQVTDIEAFTGDLVAFARTRLASYKVPRQVVLVDDLRRDQNGKLRRDTVRQLLIGRL